MEVLMRQWCSPCSPSWLIFSPITMSPGNVFLKASGPGVTGLQIAWASLFSSNWGCHIGIYQEKPTSLSPFRRESDAQGCRWQRKASQQPDTGSQSPSRAQPSADVETGTARSCLASITAAFSQCFCQVQEEAQRGEEVNHANDWRF